MELLIREACSSDLEGILALYSQLHDETMPEIDDRLLALGQQILNSGYQHILIGCVDEKVVSSCVLNIIQNLTHGQRPYALIENVVTDEPFRHQGYATSVLNYAKELAIAEHCYKIMLLTGSKKEETLNFYRRAGYNSEDKTGFIQWLE